MPKGPKGEYRPTDPIKSAMLMMRIATGEITEAEAEAEAQKLQKKKPVKSSKAKKR